MRAHGPSVPERFQFGLVACSTHSIPQLLEELRQLLADKTLVPRTVLYLNAHVYNVAAEDSRLCAHLNAARIVAADGMGIVWMAPLFGGRVSERCNMTEAFRAFLKAPDMPPSTAILVGCSQEEADAAAVRVNQVSGHCRIVRAFSGFLSDAEYRQVLEAHREVDFVFLGMGTPRSEQISGLATGITPRAIVWAIGGGTIRIYAGIMKEAPAIWRRLGLQWLHRLASDPATLWPRYLIGNPLFVCRILSARLLGSSR
jgi:exopolysaccharide biosynthesis WecB/TagA/CpsF family protein